MIASFKPFLLPQIQAGVFGAPFLRGYCDKLSSEFDIPPAVQLDFIDQLNRAIVSSPPLQVLGLVGTVVGFVPSAIASAVGAGVSLAAGIGARVASKSASDIYVDRKDGELFRPRGLTVKCVRQFCRG